MAWGRVIFAVPVFYQQLFYVPPPPPVEIPPVFYVAPVTTGAVFSRTLFYQAKIAPPTYTGEGNAVTIEKWQQPLSKAVPARPVFNASYTPFVAKAAVIDTVTPDKWHRDLSRAVARPRSRIRSPATSYRCPRQ